MLERLVQLQYMWLDLRRQAFRLLFPDGDSHFALGGLLVLLIIVSGPATLFVITTPAHVFFWPFDLIILAAIAIGILLLFTVVAAPLGLIFL